MTRISFINTSVTDCLLLELPSGPPESCHIQNICKLYTKDRYIKQPGLHQISHIHVDVESLGAPAVVWKAKMAQGVGSTSTHNNWSPLNKW